MNVFNFNIKKYTVELVPPFLRDELFYGFVAAFIAPLIDVYDLFLQNRDSNLIKLRFNYQTASLEYRLNDRFDPVLRRIKIEKSITYKGVYLYTEAEIDPTNANYFSDDPTNKMKWLNGDEKPIYLRTEAEMNSEFDFIVQIPDTQINQIQLKAEIDYYILQSKQYQIKIIT